MPKQGLASISLGLVLAVAGCATPGRLPEPRAPLVWPGAPETPRIALAAEFRGPKDLAIEPGFLRRIGDFIFGARDSYLRRPYAVAVEGAGDQPSRIAVADTEARAVFVFDLEHGETIEIEGAGDEGALESPVGVAFDALGRLYVSDSTKRLVLRYARNGDFERVFARGLARPAGVAVDSERGVVFVADVVDKRVKRFDLAGGDLPALAATFRCPTHLTLDREGRLLVSDAFAFSVVVVSPRGEVEATIGELGDVPGCLSRPKGVATDSEGHVYVADALFDNVQIFDAKGQLLLAFAHAGDAPGELALPAGLAVDARDRIYVADVWNGRIQVFRYLKSEESHK